MSKAGMRRPNPKDPHGTESNHKTHFPKNEVPPVPLIQGEAKHGNAKARPIVMDGTRYPHKVFHQATTDSTTSDPAAQ
ncbi:MAG TPA: hypothetical protein H9845_05710 [Candidatus Agathobaculum pullicola]|nr:hypothetical protein [Candidatus Agathobaculum pullicola]